LKPQSGSIRTLIRLLSLAIIVLVVEAVSIAGDTPRIITEGVGWDRFTGGANANYLMDVLGAPDQHSNGRMMKWTEEKLDWRGDGMKLISSGRTARQNDFTRAGRRVVNCFAAGMAELE